MPNGLGVGVGSLTNLRLGSMRECVQGIGHNEEQALVTHRFLVTMFFGVWKAKEDLALSICTLIPGSCSLMS